MLCCYDLNFWEHYPGLNSGSILKAICMQSRMSCVSRYPYVTFCLMSCWRIGTCYLFIMPAGEELCPMASCTGLSIHLRRIHGLSAMMVYFHQLS